VQAERRKSRRSASARRPPTACRPLAHFFLDVDVDDPGPTALTLSAPSVDCSPHVAISLDCNPHSRWNACAGPAAHSAVSVLRRRRQIASARPTPAPARPGRIPYRGGRRFFQRASWLRQLERPPRSQKEQCEEQVTGKGTIHPTMATEQLLTDIGLL
jgi:hypothetical protein